MYSSSSSTYTHYATTSARQDDNIQNTRPTRSNDIASSQSNLYIVSSPSAHRKGRKPLSLSLSLSFFLFFKTAKKLNRPARKPIVSARLVWRVHVYYSEALTTGDARRGGTSPFLPGVLPIRKSPSVTSALFRVVKVDRDDGF